MRRIIFTVFFTSLVLSSQAQINTIFDRCFCSTSVSGFGGPIMEFSEIGSQDAMFVGGMGGVIVNNFYFGGYGQGLTNSIYASEDIEALELSFGHGGLVAGFTLIPRSAIHLTAGARLGWGALKLNENRSISQSNQLNEFTLESDNVYIVTPEAGIEVNIFPFMTASATVGYRFVNNIDFEQFKDMNLEGTTINIGIKFGWFDIH